MAKRRKKVTGAAVGRKKKTAKDYVNEIRVISESIDKLEKQREQAKDKDLKNTYQILINKEHDKLDNLQKRIKTIRI